jgi:uncharacterized protein (DUF433 family)
MKRKRQRNIPKLMRDRNQLIIKMHEEGFTDKEIAKTYNLTRARVGQILQDKDFALSTR